MSANSHSKNGRATNYLDTKIYDRWIIIFCKIWNIYFFFSAPTCPCGLRGLPSWTLQIWNIDISIYKFISHWKTRSRKDEEGKEGAFTKTEANRIAVWHLQLTYTSSLPAIQLCRRSCRAHTALCAVNWVCKVIYILTVQRETERGMCLP